MALPEHIKRVRLIARSRIAEIWEGYDERLKRKVLIKMLHPQLARDEDLRQRFEQEARILASQTHPNIVQIYEYHASAEELFLILEFVEGGTLRELLKEHTILPPAVASAIVVEILTGLHAAHEKGIIHRDLKPENILLSERGEVKIADFGLAMVRESPRLTLDGDVVGSPNYMAPEQVTGQEVTPRTDLFALGLMLFEMLTGIKLMEGTTFNESLQKVQNFQLPRFTDYGDKISPDKERVLSKLLNPKSAKRFESAEAARRALTEIGEGVSTTETAPELLRDFISMPREGEAPVVSPAPTQPRRGRWLLYLTILILFAVFLWAIVDVLPEIIGQKRKVEIIPPPDTTKSIEIVIAPEEPETTIVKREEQKPPAIKPPKPSPDTIVIDTSMVSDIPAIPDSVLLRILCHPWAEVVLDGRKIGKTPFGKLFQLKSGIHRIIFLN
ncbi:serine/threonine protein kinase, partial [bacterium]|nr:serine/threonine protein kinase [bacterium]